MTGQIIQLRKQQPQAALEAQLLGATLELDGEREEGDPTVRELYDATTLVPEDFSVVDHRNVWGLIGRLARRNAKVTPGTVFSAGQSSRLLGDSALGWLLSLAADTKAGPTTYLQVAADLRNRVRGDWFASQFEREAQRLRAGEFMPNRISGTLEGMLHTLSRDYAPDETAEGDVMDLDERWLQHEKDGTSTLIPTGIKVLDELTGGLPPALTIVAGKPGGGKTALFASMIRAMLEADPECFVGLFGLEDGTSWFTRRLTADLLGMKLREVGWKKRTPEQLDAWSTQVGPYLRGLTERLIVYRRDSINNDELIRRATAWAYPPPGRRRRVKAILVDHLGEIENRGADYWQNVSETVRRCRNFSIMTGVPMVVACHTTDDGDSKHGADKDGPPNASKMAGGRSIDRRARLMLGLHAKGEAWRATMLKGNELGPPGGCVEFERKFDAALIDPAGGRRVNVIAERAQESREQRERAELDSDSVVIARKQRRAAAEAKLKAEADAADAAAPKPPAPEPQLALLDVPQTEQK